MRNEVAQARELPGAAIAVEEGANSDRRISLRRDVASDASPAPTMKSTADSLTASVDSDLVAACHSLRFACTSNENAAPNDKVATVCIAADILLDALALPSHC
jgi:hypothetical protein